MGAIQGSINQMLGTLAAAGAAGKKVAADTSMAKTAAEELEMTKNLKIAETTDTLADAKMEVARNTEAITTNKEEIKKGLAEGQDVKMFKQAIKSLKEKNEAKKLQIASYETLLGQLKGGKI